MDTSILGSLFQIAPDLMEEIEQRALILERVAALEPIGRRALAARLHLSERAVRSGADALKAAGCIEQTTAGMEITEQGRQLIGTAKAVSRGRRMLSSLELALSRRLGVEKVCVVHGNADLDESVLPEIAQAAAQQIRPLLQGAHVLAVSGGRTLALAAEAIVPAAPMEITVVPAQGGTGGSVREQANTLAEEFARRLGGESRMLYLPDGISGEAAGELARLPQVREVLELVRGADVLLYGVSPALTSAVRRGMSMGERESLLRRGAAAEALGMYFSGRGEMVSGGYPLLDERDMGVRSRAAAVAAGASRAEAIAAVCLHHPHKLLVTDEGAAQRILELPAVRRG
ncbi:MAG: DNA-binding transcriptional regulator [Clostridia bacterium]|nr:DNA-binding transcriptional regulator [Clostridia bacterium]MBQ7053364.1 DNA-binding transcriptional regulator [Clostridia bacterium]